MRRLLANSLCHLDPRLRTTPTSLLLPLWRCVRLPCVVPSDKPQPRVLRPCVDSHRRSCRLALPLTSAGSPTLVKTLENVRVTKAGELLLWLELVLYLWWGFGGRLCLREGACVQQRGCVCAAERSGCSLVLWLLVWNS